MSSAAPDDAVSDIPTHPEEMKGSFELRVGKAIQIRGSGRITPAGIVTAGLTTFLVALAFAVVSRRLE